MCLCVLCMFTGGVREAPAERHTAVRRRGATHASAMLHKLQLVKMHREQEQHDDTLVEHWNWGLLALGMVSICFWLGEVQGIIVILQITLIMLIAPPPPPLFFSFILL